jgi:Rv0623-like transcription factor
MTVPQLSVRSAKARDLAHELSAKEKRPIHAIVEDALVAYANRQPKESAKAFLRRLGAIGNREGPDDLADLEAFIDENRKPPRGIDL